MSESMARMVDIGRKPDVKRRAVATGAIRLRPSTIRAVRSRRVEKGDPLAAAEVAALQAIKSVWQVLPHCHPIPITSAGGGGAGGGGRRRPGPGPAAAG